ncbi:MAG: (2Fe-2S)-binding protein [Candidatus Caldarchaeum sp.]|nr:(2Fe-2S)-binding protein [Candidatus Caldarchaeum sp.]MCS7133901.1 (2Fe-2S)-binding protein [Candidatus Caldarchaeum sp.]MDW8435184.1 (2Fe-2S)-binding protein [Candidatus Caldarchaeum sp.]
MKFVLNGRAVSAELKGNERLMDLLWKLGIRSVKEGCSTGDCGTCNVLVDGRLVNSCMMLAVQARNKSVVTVEGISQNEELHPIQEALIEYTASQCGYCIPGIVVTAKYILEKYPQADENMVRQILIANICRCGGYTRIVEAIKSVIESSRR